jgi:hypothetical protein
LLLREQLGPLQKVVFIFILLYYIITVYTNKKALNFGSSTFGRPTEEEDYQSEKVSSGENLEDEVYNKFFSKYEGACDKLKLGSLIITYYHNC